MILLPSHKKAILFDFSLEQHLFEPLLDPAKKYVFYIKQSGLIISLPGLGGGTDVRGESLSLILRIG